MEGGRDLDRRCGFRLPVRRATCPYNRMRRNETDNEPEQDAAIRRSRYPHQDGLRWLAMLARSRLHGGRLDESPMCLIRKSRAVAFFQRSFEASWQLFACAQRIVNRLRARVE